jgi:hypothetical protein
MMMNSGKEKEDGYVLKFSKYRPLSIFPAGRVGSVLVSPPHTIRTFETRALAWPILGVGAMPVVWMRLVVLLCEERT